MVERGLADEAVEIYATLLEETTQQYGSTSIETAPAYYEYGNSLLRAATKQQMAVSAVEEEDDDDTETKTEQKEQQRSAAAAAAESRQQPSNRKEEENKKPAAVEVEVIKSNDDEPENDEQQHEGKSNDGDDREDLNLALEMMENSFSISEEYNDTIGKGEEDNGTNDINKYSEWVKGQLPRILLGIGDTLSTLNRHADAADAYSRALELRKIRLQEFADSREGSNSDQQKKYTIEHLQAYRMVCEANILIAEELLSCPEDEDVLTTETQSLIVKAKERVSYARGYYDQARDALQEAVFFMGSLPRNVDLGREKEDVCFLATLVMGVGESLAAIDEKEDEAATAAAKNNTEPVKKKAKR